MLFIDYIHEKLAGHLINREKKSPYDGVKSSATCDSETGHESSSSWSQQGLLDETSRDNLSSPSLKSVDSNEIFCGFDKKTQVSPVKQGDGEGVEVESLDKAFQTSRKSRKLPGTWYYSSNHIMCNNERVRRNIDPVTRESELDAVARWHAENMANVGQLHHSEPRQLKLKIGMPCKIIGENVAKGATIRSIHNNMLESTCDLENILDPRFTRFGMATARGPNNELFLCQIFRG